MAEPSGDHTGGAAPETPEGCRVNNTRCMTHDLWEELGNQIQLFLASVSLADVAERRVLTRPQLRPEMRPAAPAGAPALAAD